MSNSDETADRMISFSERKIAQSLLVVLESFRIGDEIHMHPVFRDVLVGLEGFLPEVLAVIDQNWSELSVDAILPFFAFTIGNRATKFFGSCITLPSNPAGTMYVRMQVDPSGEKANWFECKLGLETRRKGKTRYRNHAERMAVIYLPDGHEDSTEWIHIVMYGTRDE